MTTQVLNTALKEWDTVCRALHAGKQMLLLRKGGIHEDEGRFEIEHRQFLFFPTFLHQNLTLLKPDARDGFVQLSAEPEKITLAGWGEVTDIVRVTSRAQVDALDAHHIWTAPLIDMRFNYKPHNPLYLLLVKAYALPQPVTIDNTPDYAGCKSWVPLTGGVDVGGSTPAIKYFDARREQILQTIRSMPA